MKGTLTTYVKKSIMCININQIKLNQEEDGKLSAWSMNDLVFLVHFCNYLAKVYDSLQVVQLSASVFNNNFLAQKCWPFW